MRTTSLELSKKLKEAGYPQESEFYFYERNYPMPGWDLDHKSNISPSRNKIASPTADEILDLLPARTDMTLSIKKGTKTYHVNYWWGTPNPLREGSVTDYWQTHGDNPADALAEMWLYLKKEGLL